ncbi:hypothetical protein ACA910_013733 [Epithemia clementina (nom. ined.)]
MKTTIPTFHRTDIAIFGDKEMYFYDNNKSDDHGLDNNSNHDDDYGDDDSSWGEEAEGVRIKEAVPPVDNVAGEYYGDSSPEKKRKADTVGGICEEQDAYLPFAALLDIGQTDSNSPRNDNQDAVVLK